MAECMYAWGVSSAGWPSIENALLCAWDLLEVTIAQEVVAPTSVRIVANARGGVSFQVLYRDAA